MKDIRELYGTLDGKEAVIIGGGIGVPSEIIKVPEGVYTIACNHHAGFLRPIDLIVALDSGNPDKLRKMGYTCPIVGSSDKADYKVSKDWRRLEIGKRVRWNSGVYAGHLAYLMKASKIYMVGFDCYTGENLYWDDPEWDCPVHRGKNAVKTCMSGWEELSKVAPLYFVNNLLKR